MSATLGGGLGESLVDLMAAAGGGGSSTASAASGGGPSASSSNGSGSDSSGSNAGASSGSGSGVPLVVSEGRSFPVKLVHLGGPPRVRERNAMEALAAATIDDALGENPGDVLCFLPGKGHM